MTGVCGRPTNEYGVIDPPAERRTSNDGPIKPTGLRQAENENSIPPGVGWEASTQYLVVRPSARWSRGVHILAGT